MTDRPGRLGGIYVAGASYLPRCRLDRKPGEPPVRKDLNVAFWAVASMNPLYEQ